MGRIRLARLPERDPVKLAVSLPPDLHAMLQEYAVFYAASYGREEPIAELVPAIVRSFLDSDRAFVRARRGGLGAGQGEP